ncbi:MAG TPA: prenyltransferase/squalene oxidase repeat-containing protein [Bryobacteraceae bacterium]|nr:prenyltransferase/squalene oxidase repeat-containing protein [Bryobacteraceae bacterium]
MWMGVLALAAALTPVEKAVAYLSRQTPAWRLENRCFSCHNNGDGARALYAAGLAPDHPALAETTAWLTHPERWDSNPGDPAVSDKKLARIQFGAALLASGRREGLCLAAEQIAKERNADGSWTIDTGSPATYGTALATYFAQRVLRVCGVDTQTTAAWFAGLQPRSTVDAAAQLLAQPGNRAARALLLRGQTRDGGWGEFPGLPAQAFDTALAVIALRSGSEAARGRDWLIARQQEEGGWPETTRPPGAQSYAQHISTSAWALLALLGQPLP